MLQNILKVAAIGAGAWLAWDQFFNRDTSPAATNSPAPSQVPASSPANAAPPASVPPPPTPADVATVGAKAAAIAGARQSGYDPAGVYTFDEWDFFYKAFRGAHSVDWERAAGPVFTDRAYRMTVDEWARIVQPFGVAGLRRYR